MKKETFKLIFNKEYFQTYQLIHQEQVRIISPPRGKYLQWWWRGLEFITFGKRFNAGYEYICETVNIEPPFGGLSKK